jgi:phage baseplate assembly protein gpV
MFEQGDPSKPFVSGSFYDNSHLPPYDHEYCSGYKTKTINNTTGHELSFNDQEGQQCIKLASSKDMIEEITDSKYTTVNGERMSVEISNGNYSVAMNSKNHSEHLVAIENGDNILQVKHGSHVVKILDGQIDIRVQKGDISCVVDDGKLMISVPNLLIKASQVNINSDMLVIDGQNIDINGELNISGRKVTINAETDFIVGATGINISGGESINMSSSKINLN